MKPFPIHAPGVEKSGNGDGNMDSFGKSRTGNEFDSLDANKENNNTCLAYSM